MPASIPEDLRTFGITSSDFTSKKEMLLQSGRNISDEDVYWELYEDLVADCKNYETLQMLFWNMALFLDKQGKDSFEYQQKSHQARLLGMEENGVEKVKVKASACCSSCNKRHNLVMPLKKALLRLPVPNKGCQSTLFSEHIWCTAIYTKAQPRDKDSGKLPPAEEFVPEPPRLKTTHGETPKDEEKEKRVRNGTRAKTQDYALPFLLFVIGGSLLFWSPVAGVVLIAWSMPFIPQLWDQLQRRLPFISGNWTRYGLGLLGLLVAVLLLLLFELVAKHDRMNTQKPLPAYHVLTMEDQSSMTRSRLLVRIAAPKAMNAKERARVVIHAARQMQQTQLSGNPDQPNYEYVSVILEADPQNPGSGYVLAQAEFAPDGRGREGLMRDDPENLWTWKVGSSKARINPGDRAGLKALRNTLEPFMKK